MRGAAPPLTQADRKRFDALSDLGCLACRHEGRFHVPPEIHHLNQRSNALTIPLCAWHHRGVIPQGLDLNTTVLLYGPSLALDKRTFVRHYGAAFRLLAESNRLLDEQPAGFCSLKPTNV